MGTVSVELWNSSESWEDHSSQFQAKLDAINNQTVWVTTVRLWYVLREYSHCHQKRREVAVPCSFHSDGFINQGINHRDGNEGEFRALTMIDRND